jgi:hypothetical protein
MTACGRCTSATSAWHVSMNGNAKSMANRPVRGGSSGRPSGSLRSHRPLCGPVTTTNRFPGVLPMSPV